MHGSNRMHLSQVQFKLKTPQQASTPPIEWQTLSHTKTKV